MKNIKKYWKVISLCVLVMGTALIIFIYFHDSSFVKKNLVKYTGLKEFITKFDYYDNHQSYIESVISNIDKQKLVAKFKFENSLIKLKGRVECPFISENPNYIYYVIEDGYGPYGYILYALEKEGNTFVVYEAYGN